MSQKFEKPVKLEHFDQFLRISITLSTCIKSILKHLNHVSLIFFPFQNISTWYILNFLDFFDFGDPLAKSPHIRLFNVSTMVAWLTMLINRCSELRSSLRESAMLRATRLGWALLSLLISRSLLSDESRIARVGNARRIRLSIAKQHCWLRAERITQPADPCSLLSNATTTPRPLSQPN